MKQIKKLKGQILIDNLIEKAPTLVIDKTWINGRLENIELYENEKSCIPFSDIKLRWMRYYLGYFIYPDDDLSKLSEDEITKKFDEWNTESKAYVLV